MLEDKQPVEIDLMRPWVLDRETGGWQTGDLDRTDRALAVRVSGTKPPYS
jgi:hypothetical protein